MWGQPIVNRYMNCPAHNDPGSFSEVWDNSSIASHRYVIMGRNDADLTAASLVTTCADSSYCKRDWDSLGRNAPRRAFFVWGVKPTQIETDYGKV